HDRLPRHRGRRVRGAPPALPRRAGVRLPDRRRRRPRLPRGGLRLTLPRRVGREYRPTMAVISAHGLVKRFGSTTALDGLDLRVEAGEVHGFLGPNGAGKSTAIRILLGLLRPHAGTVRLLGGDPWDEAPELHRRLAYVPGDVSLWPTLTGVRSSTCSAASTAGSTPAGGTRCWSASTSTPAGAR